ncbi:hypothetical protein DAETH_46150 (plasmid) [Deinococcus aetherius]|uniref:Uncharacterized protein n=1 Tax=Deinococcus aetherius TaxID=200252 RepID=A0ABM8ALC3_9DEIO|nr:hypothetical protein [Deinococcus aetherius]BDP44646.1 hypothetical protein DAETH_46150 [Deinococcus aetherius]
MTTRRSRITFRSAWTQRPLPFDWAVVALGGLMLFGVHLDAWAHHRYALETFFTPWHGLLYSGYALLALLLAVRALRGGGLRPGAMPAGYEWSLVGAGLFALGGLSDLAWHTRFGIEVSVEALLSPPHLLLALGAGLMVAGPVRAALARGDTRAPWPALAALALLLSLLTFFTAYVNPLAETDEVLRQGVGNGLGPSGVLVQAALLSGVVLFAARRFTLPFGGLTLLVTLSAALMLLVHADYTLLPTLLAAGLLADGFYAWLRPSRERSAAFRAFAALVPATTFVLVLTTFSVTGGLSWSATLTAGAVTLAAMVGWLLSFAFLPGVLDQP